MNKKITVIELLNKIANKDSIPKAILYENEEFVFNGKSFVCCDHDTTPLIKVITSLNDYVEILEDDTEDNTEEIEELPDYNYSIKENRDKINELVKRINYIERKINEN